MATNASNGRARCRITETAKRARREDKAEVMMRMRIDVHEINQQMYGAAGESTEDKQDQKASRRGGGRKG
eukprot:6184378-Pleurochrysis_carterae.AAC.3